MSKNLTIRNVSRNKKSAMPYLNSGYFFWISKMCLALAAINSSSLLALALGFESSGLALWLGSHMTALENVPLLLLLFILIAYVNFLTEITSNLATTAMLLPVLVSIASAIGVHPFFLLVGATVAASCAFMLPVATPPNAVVFGSGLLKIDDMVKKGIWMNVISIALLTFIVYYIMPLIWDLG